MKITQHFTYEELNRDNLKLSPFLLQNLWSLACFLEIIRLYFRRPIIVTSGLRSKEHNKRIGGVENSLHLIGKAVDISCDPKDFKDLSQIVYFVLDGACYKNIKVYQEHHPKRLYIHIGFGERDETPLSLLQNFPFALLPTHTRQVERVEAENEILKNEITQLKLQLLTYEKD